MAAPIHPDPFDPLIDLDGLWTIELAQRYLPIEGAPPTRYEAESGKLIMSPREGSGNSWAAWRLAALLHPGAAAAGHAVYTALHVRTEPQGWIEPDLVVLRQRAFQVTWVEPSQVLMPVEIVSRSSRRRDRIDKPATCARLGIPYYMRVEISGESATVDLLRLGTAGHQRIAAADAGGRLLTDEPFAIDFNPAELLE